MSKSILIFSVSKLEDMQQKGNISYIKHYESYFDNVYMVYLTGSTQSFQDGKTSYISLGKENAIFNLILAPIRLYKFAKNRDIDVFLTGDLVFSWWNSLLIKFLKQARVFLIPVAMPHVIYKSSHKTMTGILPYFIEKLFIYLSFLNAYRVVTGKNITQYIKWLSSHAVAKSKLLIVEVLVDELPSIGFFDSLNNKVNIVKREKNILLYVGRLHKEKLVFDIVKAFEIIKRNIPELELWLIGNGEEEKQIQKYCIEKDLESSVKFLGFKQSSELVPFYKKATLFVSPLTGTSLREAALCSLPIVCYKMDWVAENFKDEEQVLFVENSNINDFAQKIEYILKNSNLYNKLQKNMNEYAFHNWSIISVEKSLNQICKETLL